MKLYMEPRPEDMRGEESGIKRVVEKYYLHLPKFGAEFTRDYDSADVRAVHINGTQQPYWDVFHCHGLYWTADYPPQKWELEVNRNVIETARHSKIVTVPSAWVAEPFQRDMRINPLVVGHGVDWKEWQSKTRLEKTHILWNKNRSGDVCDPRPVAELAHRFRKAPFITTFWPETPYLENVTITGVVSHQRMRDLVMGAAVYLATTKETFGIGTLEAMAAGVPILGFDYGGNAALVQHGVNGYLARPGNYDDLADGLEYCLQNRDVLGENSRELAKAYTWEAVCERLIQIYAGVGEKEPPTVSVIIPCFNYGSEEKLGRALRSVLTQKGDYLKEVIIVDDGSADEMEARNVVSKVLSETSIPVDLIRQDNAGVANARNLGIAASSGKYVCCLDADDAIEESFLQACVGVLEQDVSLGIAYSRIRAISKSGESKVTDWPGRFDFGMQMRRRNQIPTCCVFRREMWKRLGGYRQRYSPKGAGAEDAEFWLRAGAYGWGAVLVDAPLFVYSLGTGRVSSDRSYKEVDWTTWHPWTKDGQHPFASIAAPIRFSHQVRQYDEPVISVIIPVGAGHEKDVINALDSLEAQTFRKWEAIVVWDTNHLTQESDGTTPDKPEFIALQQAYPYVRWVYTAYCEGNNGSYGRGAGFARNVGVKTARASLITFLDADDQLYPQCLQRMLEEHLQSGAAVYTDYVMLAYVDDMNSIAKDLRERVYEYDEETHRTVFGKKALEYSCERASLQPVPDDPYLWNLVTTLFPKKWHYDIGGFDETLKAWEDVDYWWRMARAGKCFQRIPEELVVYRCYSGNRREVGRNNHKELMQYLVEKFKGVEVIMAKSCRSCSGRGGGAVNHPLPGPGLLATQSSAQSLLPDDQFVRCSYQSPNTAKHHVVGFAQFASPFNGMNMIRRGKFYIFDYGYHRGGEALLVHREDIKLNPKLYVPIQLEAVAVEEESPKPLAAPEPLQAPLVSNSRHDSLLKNVQLPFVGQGMIQILADKDVHTIGDLIGLGEDELSNIKGMTRRKIESIVKAARKYAES